MIGRHRRAARLAIVVLTCTLAMAGLTDATAAASPAGGTFQTHSYGADFAQLNFGDSCDDTRADNKPYDFRNDWLSATFHGQFADAPWRIEGIDLTNTSSQTISFRDSRWTFYVRDAPGGVADVPVGGLEPGATVHVPVDLDVGWQKVVAVAYPVVGFGACGQARLLVDHG